MYDEFKNIFISDLISTNIKLNSDQISKVLSILDSTASHFDILNKHNTNTNFTPDGIPESVYEYIKCKKAEGLAKETLYTYKVMLEIFFKYIKKRPELVEAQDIISFLVYYQEKNGVENRTLDKYRSHICCYFQWMHDFGFIPKNPGRMVNKIKYEIKPKAFLTEYEMELVREACITRREKAMIEFFLSTGCRVGELVKVKINDCDLSGGTVHLFGKGSKHRTSFITPRARLLIERYLQYRDGESEYLFIHDRKPFIPLTERGAELVVRNIMARLPNLQKHITPHSYRRSSATAARSRGMSTDSISKWLGHSDLRVTEVYLANNDEFIHNEFKRYMH